MAFTNARLTAVNTTVTAAVGAASKVAACLPGLLDVVVAEVSKTAFLTPGQQQRLAVLRADLVANAATMQTALGL